MATNSIRSPAEQFAQLVEQNGSELGVTLLVRGAIIEGILTPLDRWTDYALEALTDMKPGGRTQASRAPALTAQGSEEVKRRWEREYGHLKGNVQLSYDRICLRNATLQTVPNPDYWPTYPFMLIETASIDAFTLGTVKQLY